MQVVFRFLKYLLTTGQFFIPAEFQYLCGIFWTKNNKNYAKRVALACFLLTTPFAFSQKKSVKLKHKDSLKVECFRASVNASTDFSDYNLHERSYFVDFDLNFVWNSYLNVNPYNAWAGPINKTKLLFHPEKGYLKNHIEEGTVLLIELNFFKKLKLDALFLVTDIDAESHRVKFCYGKDNVTEGEQQITFEATKDGTVIEHITYYKSSRAFRDKLLYPIFHKKCIDEFHATMNSLMLRQQIEQNVDIPKVMASFD